LPGRGRHRRRRRARPDLRRSRAGGRAPQRRRRPGPLPLRRAGPPAPGRPGGGRLHRRAGSGLRRPGARRTGPGDRPRVRPPPRPDRRGPGAAAGRPARPRTQGGRGMTATIDATGLDGLRPAIDPAIEADAAKFDRLLAEYEAGRLDEDRWRVFRLANGIYGQRQGGTNQMVRVKIPYGSLRPEQLEMLGRIARTYSRGWGHITTRQNVQFHYVELHKVTTVMRELGSVGLTTREACGDTVRNVQGCHLAGACPFEVLDISPWAEATFRHLLRHPYAQRLPRKFKINFSGCATDCGQAMFNDVGVVAVTRARPDGTTEAGFRVFIAGGLGATPHPALALEDFTPREELLATIEAALRVFDHAGNRDNKLRARMKWLVDTLGIDELRARVLKERRLLVAA